MMETWAGEYGGTPNWSAVRPENFEREFDLAIAEALQEIAQIVDQKEAPSFENTMIGLERAGKRLVALSAIFYVHCSNLNIGDMPAIEKRIRQRLVAYQSQINQNQALFARIGKLYENKDDFGLEERRLLERLYLQYILSGASLSEDKKSRLREIEQEIQRLQINFKQNILVDQTAVTWVYSEHQLAGLDKKYIATFRKEAENQGKPDAWAIKNTQTIVLAVLQACHSRELREEVWHKYYARGANQGIHDNNRAVPQLLHLRAEKAKLLGYPSHAHLQLTQRMAKTPQIALDFLMSLWTPTNQKAEQELQELQDYVAGIEKEVQLQPWDISYYGEKLKKERYALDSKEISEYLQLETMVGAIHNIAEQVFGLCFQKEKDIPVFHPDVSVYSVSQKQTGEFVGYLFFDPFARDGKKSGAWNTSYRVQQNFDGKVFPIYANNLNIMKPYDPEMPILLSWTEAKTLFHEFGHALHGLLSNVKYPSLAGSRVPRDFVEFPSQLFECWLDSEKVLRKYALHFQTGEPFPVELIDKMKNAANFHSAIDMVQYLSSALIDLRVHLLACFHGQVDQYEQEFLRELDYPPQLVMRYRLAHFQHIFSSGYSAGYYSYRWADALTADAAEYFEAQEDGFFDQKVAQKLINAVLSIGDTVEPEKAFRNFRGRDLDNRALLRKMALEDVYIAKRANCELL